MDETISKRDRSFPWGHLAIVISVSAGFILFLPSLGFYWDDWLVIFHVQSARYRDLITLYAFDRPLSSWTALLSGPILGTAPILWQLFSLALRSFSGILLYKIICEYFPRRKGFALWTAILFAIYPAYSLQPISVAFSQHWISYTAFFLSIYLMVRIQREPKGRVLKLLVSLFFALLHLVTLEYFAGLELIRPLLLIFLISQIEGKSFQSIKKAILAWAPYLGLLTIWAIWRLFFIEFPIEPHPPVLLTGLRDAPLQTLLEFLQTSAEGIFSVLFVAWGRILSADFINMGSSHFWISLGIAFALTYAIFAVIRRLEIHTLADKKKSSPFLMLAFFGFVSLLLGLIPIWVIGENPVQLGYNERFALPAMLGAAMLLTSLIFQFVSDQRARTFLLTSFLLLALIAQQRAVQSFQEDWRVQLDYFEQIAWRAPDIQENTAFLFYAPLSEYMPASSTSAALNSLYQQSRSSLNADFWYFDLELSRHVREIEGGNALENNYRGMLFEADSSEALLYFYQADDACLWLLSPLDKSNPYLPPEVQQFAPFSNVNRILPSSESNLVENPIFDVSPKASWCYFYQEASRRHQANNWGRVLDLLDEIRERDLQPENALEWAPFLSAAIHTQDWPLALELSKLIHQADKRTDSMLCAYWIELEEKWSGDESGFEASLSLNQIAACSTQ